MKPVVSRGGDLGGLYTSGLRALRSCGWQAWAEQIAGYFEAKQCVVHYVDGDCGAASLNVNWGGEGDAHDEALRRVLQREVADGVSATHVGELGDAPDRRHFLRGIVADGASAKCSVVLVRGTPFSEEARGELGRLLPFVRELMECRYSAWVQRQVSTAAAEALDLMDVAVVLVDKVGRPLLANEAARHLSRRKGGLVLSADGLRAGARATDQFRELMAQDAHGSMVLRVDADEHRKLEMAVVRLSAQAVDGHGTGPQASPTHAVFAVDPARRVSSCVEALSRLYGLTRSEASVAALLAAGSSLQEAAEALDIAVSTARTHLRRIFEKTGVRRQGELVCLLLRSVARLAR